MKPATHSSPLRHPIPRSSRGSVLVVALIFSLIIAIGLGSFIALANKASNLAYRTHYLGAGMNIAETGLELAMWEINSAPSGSKWASSRGWQSAGGSAYRGTFALGKLEGGATAQVKVYAYTGTSSWVLARAIITPPSGQGSTIEKWVKVTLTKSGRSGVGGLGRKGIVSSGNNVVMASWNSDPDNNPATLPVAFSSSVMNDKVSLATVYIDASLNSGQADVNGTAAVGSSSTDAILVGPQGFIGPFGTALGTKDPNSISTNFAADLPIETAPTGKTYTNLGSVSTDLTLPRAGDTANSDGIYYYKASDISLNGKVLSISSGSNVVIDIPKGTGTAISLSGNGGAIKVGATAVTNTATNTTSYTTGSLKIYTDADIKISGQGGAMNEITTQNYTPTSSTVKTTISDVTAVYGKGQQKNTVIGWSYKQTIQTSTTSGGTTTTTSTSNNYTTLISNGGTQPVAGTTTSSTTGATTSTTGTLVGQPINLQIFGTRSEADRASLGPQDFTISGNGNLSAVVYAPNADISAKGGGNSGFVYGSLIGYTLKFTGNDCFYYDESLSKADDGSRLKINDWDELISYVDKNATFGGTSYKQLMEF